jgi:hypothetical protein
MKIINATLLSSTRSLKFSYVFRPEFYMYFPRFHNRPKSFYFGPAAYNFETASKRVWDECEVPQQVWNWEVSLKDRLQQEMRLLTEPTSHICQVRTTVALQMRSTCCFQNISLPASGWNTYRASWRSNVPLSHNILIPLKSWKFCL